MLSYKGDGSMIGIVGEHLTFKVTPMVLDRVAPSAVITKVTLNDPISKVSIVKVLHAVEPSGVDGQPGYVIAESEEVKSYFKTKH